jgi:hypothetical protein
MIQFKQRGDEPKYAQLDFRVRHLVELFHWFSNNHNAPCVLVTDINTPGVHMAGGPHDRLQAVDLSIRTLGLPKAVEFAKYLNSVYDYGRGFNVALCGEIDPHGKHDDHLHLQVPPPYQLNGRIELF